MPLARLTNYVDGNVLTGAQLNNEFDNILNNGPALINAAIPGVSIVQGLTGSLISNIGSFQANAYQLKSTTTIASLTATSSYSVNTQTAGPIAGGRDQAAVFASTDVHFYAITTGGTSTNAAGICSTKPPTVGPTLPAGYSAWAYLASAKYNITTSVVSTGYRVAGSRVSPMQGALTILPQFKTSEVAITISTQVPSVATRVQLKIGQINLATSVGAYTQANYQIGIDSLPTNYDLSRALVGVADSTGTGQLSGSAFGELINTGTVYAIAAVTVGSSATGTLILEGYQVPNGDV